MRAVFHLGLMRTGTSSIHRMLLDNRALLAPHTAVVVHEPHLNGLRKAGQAFIQDGEAGAGSAFRKHLATLRRTLETDPSGRAIVADENLHLRRIYTETSHTLEWTIAALNEIAAAFAGHETVFVLYHREAEAWLRSAYNQEVKRGRCRLPWLKWRRGLPFDPDGEAFFGRVRDATAQVLAGTGARLEVVAMEEEVHAGELGRAVLEAAGLPAEVLGQVSFSRAASRSLPPGALEFMRRINRSALPNKAVLRVSEIVERNPDLFAAALAVDPYEDPNDPTRPGRAESSSGARAGGKISLAELGALPALQVGEDVLPMNAMARLEDRTGSGEGDGTAAGGLRLDYLWAPRPGADRLVVLFSGDALRSKFDPPVFQRWSWAPAFNAHCLCVSDPALWLAPGMGLGWYVGTEAQDPQADIARAIRWVADQAGVAPYNVWSYGSSGGGFAALRLAATEGFGAIALNPQSDILGYEGHAAVNRLLALCFAGRDRAAFARDFPDRASLIGHAPALARGRIALVQNRLDPHHMEGHYRLLVAAMGMPEKAGQTRDVHRLLWDGPGGHRARESEEMFFRCLDIIGGSCAAARRD